MASDAFHYAHSTRKGKQILTSPAVAELNRPRAGRPTREQADARHAELLDTALDMFLDRGFEQTTVEALAASVNMTKRTVYAHYPDKAALFKAAVRRAIDRSVIAREAMEALDSKDLETTLVALGRMRVAHVMTREGLRLQRIIATESYRFPEIFTWSFEDGAGPFVDYIAELLARHDSAGAVCIDRPRVAATVFMSMVVGGPVRILVSGNLLDQPEIDRRIAYAVSLFLNGVRPR